MLSKPFLSMGATVIETLEPLSSEDKGSLTGNGPVVDGVIEEREGVHYISGEILNPGPEDPANFNQDFKNLVDSVIK